jgi:hypothetical protein
MAFDVFLSHASEDAKLANVVCSALESRGVKCFIAPRDIRLAEKWAETVSEAIEGCRALLLLLSDHANQSPVIPYEVEQAATSARRKQIITVRLTDAGAPSGMYFFLKSHHWYEAVGRDAREFVPDLVSQVCSKLHGSSTPPLRPAPLTSVEPAAKPAGVVPAEPETRVPVGVRRKVALVYRRRATPDNEVLAFLESKLARAGHTVFVDRHLTVGVDWARTIEEELTSADAVVILLSKDAVQSDMLTYEVQIAHQASQVSGGKPVLLPVRIDFDDRLADPLAGILDRVQYFGWTREADNERLGDELLGALAEPPGTRGVAPDRRRAEKSGFALGPDALFYIERPTDALFREALERRDFVILLKGAHNTGKSSLLLGRGKPKAHSMNMKVVTTDFQKMTGSDLKSLEDFYLYVAEELAYELGIKADPRDTWNARRGPNLNFERFVKREVLAKLDVPLFWAMDEADKLLRFAYCGEVFGLFRAWHNELAGDPTGPWSKLTIVIAYASEAHLFITNPDQSPFTIGTGLELRDFTPADVAQLNRRHGGLVTSAADLDDLYTLIGGQPFLNHRWFDELSRGKTSIEELKARADQDDGPFGDHLHRLLTVLAPHPELLGAVGQMLGGGPRPASELFFRLRAAGVVSGASSAECRMRCGIYASYLKRELAKMGR